MLLLQEYNLPDRELLEDESSDYRYKVWNPERTCIILGASNSIANAVHEQHVATDKIPVIKRNTGGQSVVLSSNMICVSAILNSEKQLPFRRYFELYNEKIIFALQLLGVKELATRGISDITLGIRKITGSAIYRNPRRIFFHAVLNVAEDPKTIERYLTFPKIIPDYRAGRSHLDFVTSLHQQGYHHLSLSKIQEAIAEQMRKSPNQESD